MADNKVNSGLLEFSEDQKVFVALDAETSEVKKAVTIDGDGVETDIAGGGSGDVTVEALSVTENGTYSEEGKAYSPVTVNVAGAVSDFSTVAVTVVNNEAESQNIEMAFINEAVPEVSPAYAGCAASIESDETKNLTAILYKGTALATFATDDLTVTGSASIMGGNSVAITGSCTIIIGTK